MMIIIFDSANQSKTVYANRTLDYLLNSTKFYDRLVVFFLQRQIKNFSKNKKIATFNIN